MSDDYTKLIEEARKIAAFGGFTPTDVLHALADAVEALTAENEKLRNAENLLAMDALALSQSTTMSLDRAAEFLERIIQQATDHREIGAVRAERDALRAQLNAALSCLSQTDPGNPFMYDPSEDASVDESNRDEVVEAAVSIGWNAGAFAVGERIRAAIRLAAPVEGEQA